MENRKRPLRMIIRVDEKEKEIILSRMKEAKQKDFSTFARRMLLNGLIITPNWEELKEIHRQLSGVSNNVNQVARIANSTRSVYKSDVDELTRQVAEIRSMMFDLVELMGKIENGGK
ncbi:plasmid mobilization protein [Butyricicoccus sp.]|uniref:plasmid mobilization protein n=1 Tax=Butyricicoccus sp. TaxID=2049021 RepID=UPI003D7EF1A0